MKFPHQITLLAILFILAACSSPDNEKMTEQKKDVAQEKPLDYVPQWAQEAVWYQIFVERFRNGDPSNDPTPADLANGDPPFIPENWSVTPWDHDWYENEPWLEDSKANGFYHKIQQRRFGGDLQGVLDKVDYIADLGVTAVYFNPLNDAPSMHKFDARNWRHIDRNFGPDPKGDAEIMASEVPDDPSTWKWTAADKMFLDVVKAFHAKGIKVILDYSWNHTGLDFWAIHDLREKGPESKFVDWYNIKKFDDPNTEGVNEFEYEGWAGYMYMPVVNKNIIPEDDHEMPFEGNLVSESLKEHIYAVSRRWLDPDGDGDPSDGIDGYRLDVAGEIPMGFWRDYRKVIREVNPEAYLLGEIWWLEWPEVLLGPRPYLKGDQFDAIMNYRWYRLARGFFAQAEPIKSPSEFVTSIDTINRNMRPEILRAMMNMSSSHDAPRLGTSFYNKTQYKFQAKPSDNADYKVDRPDDRTWQEVRLFLLHQYSFIGSPQIWNGDEMGMWGADDPDCRKPLIWDDLEFKDEVAHYYADRTRPVNEVKQDKALMEYYRQLTRMRRDNRGLIYGDVDFVVADDDNMTLAYKRSWEDQVYYFICNRSNEQKTVQIPNVGNGEYSILLDAGNGLNQVDRQGENLAVTLAPLQGVVLVKK